MGIEYESVVDHPLAEVFAWHTRPGAMTRLVPPWQPMTVVSETESLADGQAVLGLPGGLRWIAQHDRDSFDPPHRFADVLSSAGPRSLPPRVIGWWRHTHEFSEAPGGGTTVRDEVDTTVPGAALRPTFVYRHRQLADDLAAHRDAASAGAQADGRRGHGRDGSGRVGPHRVSDDRRSPGDSAGPTAGARPRTSGSGGPTLPRPTCCRGSTPWCTWPVPRSRDGSPRATRPRSATAASNRRAGSHRRRPTATTARQVFVSASAIGIYGYDRGDALLCEESVRGDGFLADVVADWEAATGPAADAGLRVVTVRTGIVQAAAGGTLRLLRPLFLAGLGGRMGSGRQWLSWIGLDDLLDVYYRALYDTRLTGPVNAVGPAPVRNIDYTKALAGVLHRPALVPVPSFGPRLLLGGQGARELAEADQRVVPTKLTELGHRFRHATVADALAHQLGHG